MFKGISDLKKGLYLALLAAVISGGSNFFNKFAMTAVGKDAFQYTALKNIISVFVLSLIIIPFVASKIKKLNGSEWLRLIAIGIIGGSIPFLLFFKGLSLTSAVNASFIHKTLFIWVAILAAPFLREKISRIQILALGMLLGGVYLFGGINFRQWGYAEILIFSATLLWAIEFIIAKQILKNIDSLTVAWSRMFFGSVVIFGFLVSSNRLGGIADLNINQLNWLVLTGLLLSGYVISWYAAMKYLPVTVLSSILVLAFPITSLLNSIFIKNEMSGTKIWGTLIIMIGILAIYKKNESKTVLHKSEYLAG